jgi:hypothetical protein
MGAWFTKEALGAFFSKYGLQLAILAAIVGGLWYVDHRGFERAKAEDLARANERALITQAVVSKVDGDLAGKLNAIGGQLGIKIDTLDREGKTVVQPIITRELAADPRLAAPGSCLTPGLLDAINAARGYPAGELVGQSGPASARVVPGSPSGH